MGDAEDKKVKKAALKKEAETLGVTYDELKKSKKSKKREAEKLDTEEHQTEIKRLRTYSKDLDGEETESKRRRTRSMDKADEDENITSLLKLSVQEKYDRQDFVLPAMIDVTIPMKTYLNGEKA